MEDFADGVDNIITTQKNVALNYFQDGGIEHACPPLKALLHIMAHGHWEGKGLEDPDFRSMFTREALLASDWYQARLTAKRDKDRDVLARKIAYLEAFLTKSNYQTELRRLRIRERLEHARALAAHVESPAYLADLVGMIGLDPALR
jgi:hypothetical protein